MPPPTQPPPPPFLRPSDPTLIQRQLNIPRFGDPRLQGALTSPTQDLAAVIAALADVQRVGREQRGARAGRGAELGALQDFAALQNIAFGTGVPQLPAGPTPLAQVRQQQAEVKEARVRNLGGRRRARKEALPATKAELVTQTDALVKMIQNPEFFAALQENEASRQVANSLLASRGIDVPSLQEAQAGQELTTSQRDFAAFQKFVRENPNATEQQLQEARFRFGLIPSPTAALPAQIELAGVRAGQATELQRLRQEGILDAIRLRAALRKDERAFSSSIKDKELRRKLADNLTSAEETAVASFDDRFPDLDTAKAALQDPFLLRAWKAINPFIESADTLTQAMLDEMRKQWAIIAREDALANMRDFGVAPEQLRPTPPQPEPVAPQPGLPQQTVAQPGQAVTFEGLAPAR